MTNRVATVLIYPRVQTCVVIITDLHPRLRCEMEAYSIGATTKKSVSRVQRVLDVLVVEEIVNARVSLLLLSPFTFPHVFDFVAFVSKGLSTLDGCIISIVHSAVEEVFLGSVAVIVAVRTAMIKTTIKIVNGTARCMRSIYIIAGARNNVFTFVASMLDLNALPVLFPEKPSNGSFRMVG